MLLLDKSLLTQTVSRIVLTTCFANERLSMSYVLANLAVCVVSNSDIVNVSIKLPSAFLSPSGVASNSAYGRMPCHYLLIPNLELLRLSYLA